MSDSNIRFSDLLDVPLLRKQEAVEPDLVDAFTNELTINKLSMAFARIYGLPVGKYQLDRYEEERSQGGVLAKIHLGYDKTRVTVQIHGPLVNGQFNWGLKIGQHNIKETQLEGGIKHYLIDGYLKAVHPELDPQERTHGAQDVKDAGSADSGSDQQAGLHRPVRIW